MEDSVHCPDVRQKRIPQSLPGVGSADQPSDVIDFEESADLPRAHPRAVRSAELVLNPADPKQYLALGLEALR